MKTLENVMHKSWKKSQGQNRTERFNDVAKAIRSYYLSILPEKKYGLAGVVSHHSAGFNKARAKMERKIKGKK